MLDGREYGNVITRDERNIADVLGFVVVFGASDDLMEFCGAIEDEFGCYNGGTAYLTKNGLFEECECNCKWSERVKLKCQSIEAVWHNSGEYNWTYDTDIPHEKFDIMEDENEKYCQGIVFKIKDLE